MVRRTRIFRQVLRYLAFFVAFEVTIGEAAVRTALDGVGGGARFPAPSAPRPLSVRPLEAASAVALASLSSSPGDLV